MPVSFLSDGQALRYGRFAGDPTPEQLARFFHLDDADRAFVGEHRGDHNRLGVAVQLGSLRLLGTLLEDVSQTPVAVARFAGDQLAMTGTTRLMKTYVASAGRWRHGPRIRDRYGYRQFTDFGVAFRLNRFLYAVCWTGTDRPSTLFDRAVSWLLAAKVMLPGLSVLERAIARVRARVHRHLHSRLVDRLTPEQRERLDGLVRVAEDGRQSPLDRLRDGPYLQSGPEIGRAVKRLEEVRELAAGLPELDRIPPGKAASLARFASVAKAQAVARLPDDRRAATLVAFIRTLEASAGDDVIDLFDVVSTTMFSHARATAREARIRTLRDLDAAALLLRDAGAVLLDDDTADGEVRAAVFAGIERTALAEAVAQITLLALPGDATYFAELRRHPGKLRYLPALLGGIELEAAPAGKPLLDAVDHLRSIQRGAKKPGPAPTAFAPKAWAAQLRTSDGAFDLAGYRLATVDRLRHAIRRRDVFPVRSIRYGDPRKSLLKGAAWEAARPVICRTVGVAASGDEELAMLSRRLDLAYRETAARIPENKAVTIVGTDRGADLSVEPLDRIEEPTSLTRLRADVEARLPRVDLPELIMEMHARTGFADSFTHASEGRARAEDIATTICAVLLAEATNTGFEPLIRRDVPALRRSRLSWVKQNFMRGRDADGRQRGAGRRAERHPARASLGRRRGRLRGRASVHRARPHDPCRSQPEVFRAQARGHLVQPCLRPVHRPGRRDGAGHIPRQPVPARGRTRAGDRAPADRDHDRHGRIHRYDLRHLPSSRPPVQPSHRRHGRHAVLAGRPQGRLRPPGRARLQPDQHEAHHRALGRPAAARRVAETGGRACGWTHPRAPDQRSADQARPRASGTRTAGEVTLPPAIHR